MTPKEKAQQLVEKFFYGIHKRSMFHAKRNALITVDEIMIQCWDYREIDLETSYNYWQQVKQEIELL